MGFYRIRVPGTLFRNPFRPGAGHTPPYLAGREGEDLAFRRLLDQDIIFENLILTGLRGVGKTVLLDALKPVAIQHGWLWVGTDLLRVHERQREIARRPDIGRFGPDHINDRDWN